MTKEGKEIIIQIVENIRKAYGLSFPVDVRKLAFSLGVVVRESRETIGTVAGRYKASNDTSFIEISSAVENENEKRYIIAHELGHGILHANLLEKYSNHEECTFTMSEDHNTEFELEADEFAVELLMPREECKKMLNDIKIDDESISVISAFFGVSQETAKYRCLNLN